MTHPDTDVLAEFRAGLITGRRGARITAHLAGCDRCTALDDQLAGVSVLLASVPAPAMPDSVARRLDTALAAEVASRDNAERAGGDGAAESPAPRRPGGHRGFRLLTLRVLAPAAAVVVLAAGGYGLSRLVGPGQMTASSSAGSAARAATPNVASSGHAYAPVAGPAKGGVSRPGAVSRPQGITPTNFPLVTGQRTLSPANLAQQVRAALLVPPAARTTKTPSTQLRGCVGTLASGHQLELVESVRFEGRPATLVVVSTGADETALIAAQDCSATNPHVLDTTSLTSGISGP
jgi:hypothetical protein